MLWTLPDAVLNACKLQICLHHFCKVTSFAFTSLFIAKQRISTHCPIYRHDLCSIFSISPTIKSLFAGNFNLKLVTLSPLSSIHHFTSRESIRYLDQTRTRKHCSQWEPYGISSIFLNISQNPLLNSSHHM